MTVTLQLSLEREDATALLDCISGQGDDSSLREAVATALLVQKKSLGIASWTQRARVLGQLSGALRQAMA